MKRKLLLSALLAIFVLATGACQNNTKNKETIANMVNLDSLLASYQEAPLYYINYGNEGCLFELRVNDVLVDELTQAGTIGGTSAIINPYILKSGKQKISIKLYPNPGSKMIYSTNPYPYYKPFQLEVCMVDDKLEPGKREVVTVYKMPDIVTPKEGMPYYEFETEFEAEVPYQIEGWSNCIDLREVPDIEKRVVAEFERVRQLMIDHKFDELKQYYANKNNELGITSYESNEGCEERWNNTVKKISKANLDDWQAIEDYKLIFEADGRSVTLRSKKKKGIPSALVWIKEKEGESEWSGSYFELHLGIKKGTDKFVALP